ncbi:ead/Ea22-like family protein [Klebsiella pneumoniae]|nr:ead/Ea22-like family protein [Klebsiella pneumoniae]NKE99982.1 ead/Ea22-like family protein [Klebsiella pneumoniae]
MAQSLKAAAEKATPGEWRRASTQFNGITATPFMLGRKEVMIAGVSKKRDAEFIALANPANILALVEALEKAQAQSSKWLEAYHKAVSIGARYEERIAELESRTVTVKLPPKIERNDADGWFMYNCGRVGGGAAEWYNKALDDVGAELTAAGIKVEAE